MVKLSLPISRTLGLERYSGKLLNSWIHILPSTCEQKITRFLNWINSKRSWNKLIDFMISTWGMPHPIRVSGATLNSVYAIITYQYAIGKFLFRYRNQIAFWCLKVKNKLDPFSILFRFCNNNKTL